MCSHTRSALLVTVLSAILPLAGACSPQSRAPADDAIPYFNAILDATNASSTADLIDLVHFSTVPCTTADGLGGPPKCLPDEADGTLVEVLPFLGPEGHHSRRSDLASWPGVQGASLYAAFRTPQDTYSDESFPAGDFSLAFLLPDAVNVVVLQVTDAGIVRVDYTFLDELNALLENADVLIRPTPPS